MKFCITSRHTIIDTNGFAAKFFPKDASEECHIKVWLANNVFEFQGQDAADLYALLCRDAIQIGEDQDILEWLEMGRDHREDMRDQRP